MRRIALAIVTTTVLFIGGLGLQPASAADYPPCTITGTAANEIITGTEGNDVICTGGGNDTVNALGGNDIIIVTAPGVDTINAGSGNDTIDATLGTDSTIDAGSGDDTIYGSPGDDEITAGDGADTVQGADGADLINGGLGEDTLSGDAGNDTITGDIGADTISGGDGNDTVQAGYGNDTVTGGSGDDNLSGEVGNDNLSGDAGDDILNGGAGDDTISGGDGTDQITGEADVDTITGGEGGDTINAGDGNDDVDAGNGNDTVTGGEGNDDINGDAGNDTITGDVGDDTINGGDGNDELNGNQGDDTLIGGAADDSINGGDGIDNLIGNAGNDSLFGQSGADQISGQEGDDTLVGGDGVDALDGGSGLNICDYSAGEPLTTTCKYDDAAPVLVSSSFDVDSVDVGSSQQKIYITLRVTDDTNLAWYYVSCRPDSASGVTPGTAGGWFYGTYIASVQNPWQEGPAEWSGSRQDLTIKVPLVFVMGAMPGEYKCGVTLRDSLDHSSSYSLTQTITVNRTPAGIPSQPSNLQFTEGTLGSGLLIWEAPSFSGSPTFANYVAQYSLNGTTWMDLAEVSSSEAFVSVRGLQSNKDYWFRVRADNGGTTGQDTTYISFNWTVLKVRTSEPLVPLKPSVLRYSNLSSSGFKISWSSPEYNGGSPITDFTVEISRTNGQSWQSVKSGVSTSTTLTVSGAAAPKSLVPSNLSGTSLSLGWGLPDSNGGSAITDYQVEVTSNGSNSWTVIPHAAFNSLGFNVTNLLPGRTYQFRVSAVTSAGVGAASNIVTVTTLGAVGPNAPASLVVSGVKTNAASLSWPGVVATQKVSNYVVDVSTDGSTWISVSKRVSTSTSLALSGLKLGTSYQVRVAAVNSVGTGAYVYGSFTTLATVSTAPTALVSSNLSSSGFTLNWTAPSSNGGAAITDYVVEINGGGFSWSPISHDITGNTSITVTGLNPGIKYSVRVKAVNGVGMSKTSTTVYVTTLATTPGTVTGLTVKSVTATSAAITWTAPNTGGAKISDYLAEYSTDNGQTWKTVVKSASSSTSLTLKGLKTKTSYLVRITAKNSVGYGPVSQNLTVTTS